MNARAAALLERCGRANQIPVDIEAIIELDLGLDVVPVRGLQQRFGVDGFLSLAMAEITVDEGVFDRHPTRYRFTLAHELGHLILHADVFRSIDIKTPQEWVAFYHSIPDNDYGWLERQAYWFAGAVLVPELACIEQFRKALAAFAAQQLDANTLSADSRSRIARAIARHFNVSTGVILRRLSEIDLW